MGHAYKASLFLRRCAFCFLMGICAGLGTLNACSSLVGHGMLAPSPSWNVGRPSIAPQSPGSCIESRSGVVELILVVILVLID